MSIKGVKTQIYHLLSNSEGAGGPVSLCYSRRLKEGKGEHAVAFPTSGAVPGGSGVKRGDRTQQPQRRPFSKTVSGEYRGPASWADGAVVHMQGFAAEVKENDH